MERHVTELNEDMQTLKSLAVELVEENVSLQLENDNLKMLIDKEERKDHDTSNGTVKKPLQSKENLAMLYKEGFHICRGELFGKHRKGEDCLFCLNVLSEQ